MRRGISAAAAKAGRAPPVHKAKTGGQENSIKNCMYYINTIYGIVKSEQNAPEIFEPARRRAGKRKAVAEQTGQKRGLQFGA